MLSGVTRKMKILRVQKATALPDTLLAWFQDAKLEANTPYRYEHFQADSTELGLELFSTVYPDLLLIGVDEDSDKAKALCQLIRSKERERHTGIIFYSSLKETKELLPVECLELGADDFLSYGISPREALARINAVLRLKDMTDELRSANHRLELLSLTDELTGLHNMRSFNLQYAQFLNSVKKGENGLGIIMIDLDHFKKVNDTKNHLMGSHVISDVGKLIRLSGVLGAKACPARYGGDEYIIALLSPAVEEVMEQAEALRKLLESALFIKDQHKVRITASMGVSWVDPGFMGKQEDPIKAADIMLYRSKRLGRNQVSGMILRYPVDFDHIGRPHLVEREAGGNHQSVPRPRKL